MLCDLASNNGTFADGVPVRRRPLYNGNVIKLGDLEFPVRTGVWVGWYDIGGGRAGIHGPADLSHLCFARPGLMDSYLTHLLL